MLLSATEAQSVPDMRVTVQTSRPFAVALIGCLIALTRPLVAQEPSRQTNERTLSAFEESLVGKWYLGGDANRPCYIARAGGMLFTINEEKHTLELRATENKNLIAQARNYRVTGLMQSEEYILWSNGWWWSRHPGTQQ
jgi:hypothetical protein